MKYKICPLCGSHLDYSESCDCQREREKRDDSEIKAAEGRNRSADNGKNEN